MNQMSSDNDWDLLLNQRYYDNLHYNNIDTADLVTLLDDVHLSKMGWSKEAIDCFQNVKFVWKTCNPIRESSGDESIEDVEELL